MGTAYKLWNQCFNHAHLRYLFESKIQKHDSVGLDWITVEKFSEQLDSQINVILRKCGSGKYQFTPYREFLISKGSQKPPRSISIPTIRDKLVLSALNEVITGVYGTSVISPMPQVVISELYEVLQTGSFDAFIKIDIKSFYASINHQLLISELSKKIRKSQIKLLVEQSITTPTLTPNSLKKSSVRKLGLPEGLSTSNSLANLYLRKLDEKISAERELYRYWRYVDDILILTSQNQIDQIKSEILREIKTRALEVEPNKTVDGLVTDGFEYLGYFFNDTTVSVKKEKIVALERRLESIFREYKASKGKNVDLLKWRINLRISGFILDGHKYGWMFFYSQITDINCLFHLDWFISKMAMRYNVKPDGFKKFVRAYHEITKAIHSTNYILNLDTLTIDEKRRIVSEIYGETSAGKDNDFIELRFRKLMKRELRDIQKDVQAFS